MAAPLRNASGRWKAIQSNNAVAEFNLSQDRNGNITGVEPSAKAGSMRGVVEGGKVDGNTFIVTINWDGPPEGEYSGFFNPDGRLTGVTFDKNNTASQASWFSDRTFPLA